jgi:hypothetical protein
VSAPAPVQLTCPECGYDLRGIDSDRCPECGWEVDRTLVSRSQLPWTYRGREIGRFTAYGRTVWLATLRPKRLAAEVARPVEVADARRFTLVTALVAGVPMALLMLGLLLVENGTNSLNPLASVAFYDFVLTPPAADLTLPYAAGMTRWGVAPAAIVLFWWLAVRAPSVWLRGGDLDASRRGRAAALGHYAAAPFACIPVAVMLWLLALLVGWGTNSDIRANASSSINPTAPTRLALPALRDDEPGGIFLIAVGVTLLCFILSWIGTLMLQSRALRVSVGRTLLTALALPLTWLACAVVAFGLMPWVIGLLWLMIDSLRGL